MSKSKKTVYIAGPMRGFDDENRAAFRRAAARLRRRGWEPVTPMEFEAALQRLPVVAIMEAELAALPFFDAIYLLKGWEDSDGAKAEARAALDAGIRILAEGGWSDE